ncbi:MAG: aminomethyl-transferring glycine dehydrogenase [Planctomycetota bacterium]
MDSVQTSAKASIVELEHRDSFVRRHVGPSPDEIQSMLATLDLTSLSELIESTVPDALREALDEDAWSQLPEASSESYVISRARRLSEKNQIFKSWIGLGYSGSHLPTVIQRNILENPGWYTAYTPYQAEISQGRLEAVLNFQTMVCDLTGLEVSGASLLDEGTAAAEAMSMCFALVNRRKVERPKFFVAEDCHPQTIEVVRTRAEPLGIEIEVGPASSFTPSKEYFAFLVQYPSTFGHVENYESLISRAHEEKVLSCVASDLLSLTVLTPPGELGADVVVGNSQRFGVPFGFGGPHAAFFATRDEYKRSVPGRVVGVSVDSAGNPALRLALQTREQHIRREKATSNICTAQVLLAVIAGMYAAYHGPEGLKTIARRVHRLACILARGLRDLGFDVQSDHFFDTILVKTPSPDEIHDRARAAKVNFRRVDSQHIGIALDERTTSNDVAEIWRLFSGEEKVPDPRQVDELVDDAIPEALQRKSDFLTHPVFRSHHSETEMLRYLQLLREKDISLTRSMIPLGSCTMKLNATTEMVPITFPGFSDIHPFAPPEQTEGYKKVISELEKDLANLTGFDAISLQPNAGSQGEYAGLLVIRKYHEDRGEGHRNVCLIPSSAHGTNPASAVLAGMKVVVTRCDDDGNIDLADLEAKCQQHAADLSALMVTYPSTHGVFEESIIRICDIVHDHGGQVYMDGANLNALVGVTSPGNFGPDVAHMNLHKTFCIPHGGGGPGVGPIGVRKHLSPYLPKHSLRDDAGPESGITAVSAAPWGSAGILPISWAYISLMGRDGLRHATDVAILNANYMAARLAPHYPILYRGRNNRVAHECILDLRQFKSTAGVDVADVAKRLIDYGFHAPTMSWPVAGTLMIEPTESESQEELDRFCDAMIAIRGEIAEIEAGTMDAEVNPLKKAPHTAAAVVSDDWDRPYSRQQAAFPLPWVLATKYWPPVGLIDNLHGDRNFVCSCPDVTNYES